MGIQDLVLILVGVFVTGGMFLASFLHHLNKIEAEENNG